MAIKPSITLNFDMANMSMFSGNVRSILSGFDEDYITSVNMILPLTPNDVIPDDYLIEYQECIVCIHLQVISNVDEDLIMHLGKYWDLSMLETGAPTIPFSAFTDNRGCYPCVLANVIFPYRLATWLDAQQETGVRSDVNIDEIRVTGAPDLKEKVIALTVLNQLLMSKGLNTPFRPITYEKVTVFEEVYLKKSSNTILLRKLTAFASKTAYREAVQEYLLPGFDRQGLHQSAIGFAQALNMNDIETEEGLLVIVFSVLKEILAHHIEDRRWIDAFGMAKELSSTTGRTLRFHDNQRMKRVSNQHFM